MILSLSASIIETVVVKTTVFATSQAMNILYYGGSAIWGWYYPTVSESEQMKCDIKRLKGEVDELKQREIESIEKRIIAIDSNEKFD